MIELENCNHSNCNHNIYENNKCIFHCEKNQKTLKRGTRWNKKY